MILPDTSVWVHYLRTTPAKPTQSETLPPADELDRLIEQEQIVTCGPVVAELLAGARGAQRDELAEQLGAQVWVELKHADWLTIGHTAAKLSEQGQTTPLIDVEIAVCAVSANAELWTRDHDFERIANVLDKLRLRILD
ncbi:MAG TPA: PIN domain-containing protein [Solirubrobacteraceae bacterium]